MHLKAGARAYDEIAPDSDAVVLIGSGCLGFGDAIREIHGHAAEKCWWHEVNGKGIPVVRHKNRAKIGDSYGHEDTTDRCHDSVGVLQDPLLRCHLAFQVGFNVIV